MGKPDETCCFLGRQSLSGARWWVLVATMFFYLFFYTGRQAFGFAIPGIEAELGLSKTQLGWVSAVLLWCYALGQVVNGRLGDRFGGRRMMGSGAVLSCLFNWVVSFAQGLWGLIIPWGANGLAQSMGWAPGSRVLSNWWPPEKWGRVYGAYVFAAGLASVMAFATSLTILSLDLNWRWIFRLPVLLLLLGAAGYYIVVRDHPRDAGFRVDSQEPIKRARGKKEQGAYKEVLSNRRFLIASWAIGFQSIARYALLVWVPVHFLGAEWKSSEEKWISIALPLRMAAGALAGGWISDRIFKSRRSPIISCFLGFAALVSLSMFFIPGDQTALWIPVLFLCGFFV